MWRIAVTAALALAGCGSGDDEAAGGGGGRRCAPSSKASAPGITATTVTVGGHFPLTGPAAPGYSEIPRAIDAYFQHVNANGGVNGRKLKMIIRDDGYNPVNTVKVTKQLVLQDKVFAILGGLGTPTHTKVVDYLNAARCRTSSCPPAAAAGTTPRSTRTRSAGSPTTWSRARSSASYIAENLKGKKVAYFVQNDDFGADGVDGPGHVRAEGPGRDAADLRAGQHRHRAADGEDQGVGRRGRGARSRSPPTPRCSCWPASSSTSTRRWS